MIGLFAIAQIFEEAEEGMRFKIDKVDGEMDGKSTFSFKDFKGQGINLVRSSLIGTFMGVLPGVGGSAASILAYAHVLIATVSPIMVRGASSASTGTSNTELPSVFTGRYFSPFTSI